MCEARKGNTDSRPAQKIEILMKKANITPTDRKVVPAARAKAEKTGGPAAAMEMEDGTILTGKTSRLLGASSALLLNALKYLAGIEDSVDLLSPEYIEPIMHLKVHCLGDHSPLMHLNEMLIALSIAAVSDPEAQKALDQVGRLEGLDAHSSVILSQIDEGVFKQLGVNLTCEPQYESNKLYHT